MARSLLTFLLFLAVLTGSVGSARATALSNGETVYGTISGTATNTYTFTVSSGSFIVYLWETSTHSTSSNAQFLVRRPTGTFIGGSADTMYYYDLVGPVGAFPGTYTISVVNYQSSMIAAPYALQVVWIPGAPALPFGRAGGAMQPGVTYSDSINVGAFDIWTFQGIPSNAFSVAIGKSSGGAGFCPYMQVFKPDGTNLGVNATCTSDSRNGIAVAGTYYVYVANSYLGNGTGSYTLGVTGAGAGLPISGKNDGGLRCLTCEAAAKSQAAGVALAAQSSEITSTGGAATP